MLMTPVAGWGIMSSTRKRILVVLGFLNQDILSGFARYAREAHWVLNAFSVYHGSIPSRWRADGLLTTNVFRPELRRVVRATARGIPTVLHGCNDLRLPVPNVECDEVAVGRIAARHLMDQGHRNFAFFRYSRNRHAMLRQEGFCAQLHEAGHNTRILEKLSEHGVGAGAWFQRQLKTLPRPLGVFAEDDLLAADAIEATLDAGLRVPEDIAVMGSGNLPLISDMGRLPITSICIPYEESAYQAAALLDRMLAGGQPLTQPVIFPPGRIVPRQSTKAIAARNPLVKKALASMGERFTSPTLDVQAMAVATGISVRLLHKRFVEDLGTTPRQELERIRLSEAKHLLHSGTEKISSIAVQCGFENLRTFQRAFQRTEGVPPIAWRQEMLSIRRRTD